MNRDILELSDMIMEYIIVNKKESIKIAYEILLERSFLDG